MSSDRTKIIIAGAGIAGPVLAMLLKARGYEPVIYERSKERTDAGLSLVYVVDSTCNSFTPFTSLTY